MRRTTRTLLAALGLMAAGTTAHAQYYAYGLVTTAGAGQQLVRYNTANPLAVTTLGSTGVSLTGIDFRPADGRLYGFDGTRIYTVNTATGAASVVGMMPSPSSTGPNAVGFDFNPVPDRIRVVSGTSSYRYFPLLGGALADSSGRRVATDGSLNFASGAAIDATGAAYTNSDANPATGTSFLVINNASGDLLRIMPPNDGTAMSLGNLGVGSNILVGGFDIFLNGTSNVAFFTLLTGSATNLYTINLAADGAFTGPAQFLGAVGGQGTVGSLALAAVPEPGTWALMAAGLAGLAGVARRRRTA